MSGAVFLDQNVVRIAISEVEAVRKTLPEHALHSLAHEVVRRVASSLNQTLPASLLPSHAEIDALCSALLSEDPLAAIEFVEEVQSKGTNYDVICESYLAEAARRLGEWWDDDRVKFYDVSKAAGRIYAILRSMRVQRMLPVPQMRRYAVFAAVPGENHTLGITIATDLARDQGWDVDLFVGRDHDELVHDIEKRQTPLVGLSASSRRTLPALIKLIVALRLSNPDARILVCGQICAMNINLVGVTGADSTASDFPSALDQMERLLRSARGAPSSLV